MVLELTATQNLEWYIRSIEKTLSKRCNIKSYPLSKYYQAYVLKHASIITAEKFLTLCSKSNKYHGLIINGTFYIHPDSFINFVKDYHRREIKKELKQTGASNLPERLRR